MQTTHYIIATSAVLSPVLNRLKHSSYLKLDANELVTFALALGSTNEAEIASQIFDRVYFRHQDDPALVPLFESGSTDECRIAYHILTERIDKLIRRLRKLGKVLRTEIRKHLDLTHVPRHRVLYGVGSDQNLVVSVRTFEDDESC